MITKSLSFYEQLKVFMDFIKYSSYDHVVLPCMTVMNYMLAPVIRSWHFFCLSNYKAHRE